MMLPSILDVYAARERIRPWLSPTPLTESSWLSSAAGGPTLLKLESLNLTHSFKIRGAFNALLRYREAPPGTELPPVVTASAGNHGRAMACAAERLGIRAIVYTPAGAPRTKREAILGHRAELCDEAPDYDTAEQHARDRAKALGAPYISPYNHPDVIAGAGTVGLEIVEACPDLGTVVVPLGGGGLGSGVGIAVRAAAPGARVVGVEVEASTPFTVGLAKGAITTIAPKPTLADGLAGNLEPGSITFALIRQLVDEVAIVGEGDLRHAMRRLAADEHLIVEGAGAASVAGLRSGRVRASRFPVVALVTGANVDLDTFIGAVVA
jgi:threonine dehydratase